MNRKAIWKYQLDVCGEQKVVIPDGARPCHVGNQNGVLTVWMEVDPAGDAPTRVWRFYVAGTGHSFDAEGLTYLGTAIIDPFVWHVYYRW